jgi:hypothetical protein
MFELELKDAMLLEMEGGEQWLLYPHRHVICLPGNYYDCSLIVDIPTGNIIDRATITLEGKAHIPQIVLRLPGSGIREYLFDNPSNPVQANRQAVIVFASIKAVVDKPPFYPLDLRKYRIGDFQLGFTIENYEPGDRLVIEYRMRRQIKMLD